jgi:RNA polymerase sigma factor (sigma-70 family)
MSQTTEPLLTRVGKGDKSAVSECLNRYGGLVWSLARRLTRSQSDAEDAVQEIFISLWKSASRFDPAKSSEESFVAMISRRRIIDLQRRQKSPAAGFDPVPVDELDVAARAVNSAVDCRDEASKAIQLLDDLPPEQSKAIRLSIYSGMTHQQISDSMELPLGTIKSHIRRGLGKIRDRLSAREVFSSGGAA